MYLLFIQYRNVCFEFCTYQNLEMTDIRVDLAKMGATISHVGLQVPFTGRTKGGGGGLQNKRL